MSAENRIANFQINQSTRPAGDYDFLKVQRERDNQFGQKKQLSSYERLTKLKQNVFRMISEVDDGLISRGIAPPASYLDESYDF